jgi:uncharacterized protein (DUF58 family)
MADWRRHQPWQPTRAHVRACVLGVSSLGLALVVGRPDLAVLAVPFVVFAVWGAVTRPRSSPVLASSVEASRLREGQSTTVTVTAEAEGLWNVAAVVADNPWFRFEPHRGAVLADAAHDAGVELRSLRWGEREVGPVLVATSSAWGSYRWGPVVVAARRHVTLPVPAVFDAKAPTPHPAGLVGLNRARQAGDGSEFATVRPFMVGDRLRRINWRVTQRVGALHVTSTWAEQDSQVILIVDATNDVGYSEGVDGRASSLDIGVRAAAAVAEHHLRRGDRVGLRILGKGARTRMPAASGRAHLERILDTLASVSVGAVPDYSRDRLAMGVQAGALVVVLSPLMSRTALQHALALRRNGLTVVVVDTLPADLVADANDAADALARRVRLLERSVDVARVREVGIPVIAWRGPGSLDPVLRDMARRSSAPRLVRR